MFKLQNSVKCSLLGFISFEYMSAQVTGGITHTTSSQSKENDNNNKKWGKPPEVES